MRSISQIALEISLDWKNVNYAAKPYLEAMFSLQSSSDFFYNDDARSIIAYFLANATHYRGETARKVKLELKEHLKRGQKKSHPPPRMGFLF